jgi:CHAD domain-containing protein
MAQTEARAALRLHREHLRLQRAQSRCRTARALHRLRVQLKSLRYMQDFARTAGLRIPSSPNVPRHIGRMQRQLGEISDLRVLIRRMDRFAARHPAWRRKSAALRQHLQCQQLQRLELVVTAATQ